MRQDLDRALQQAVEILRGCQRNGSPDIPLGKCHTDVRLVGLDPMSVHQIRPHLRRIDRAKRQHHTPGKDRLQHGITARREQNDHRILRRLLQRFEQRILRFPRHLLRIRQNVNLVPRCVGLDLNIAYKRSDIID